MRKYEAGTNDLIDAALASFPDQTLYMVTGQQGEKAVLVDNTSKAPIQAARMQYRYGIALGSRWG